MDPNATLHDIELALLENNFAAAREAARSLDHWLDAGGFAPQWTACPLAARWMLS